MAKRPILDGSSSASALDSHNLGHRAPIKEHVQTPFKFSSVVFEVCKRIRVEKFCRELETLVRKVTREEVMRGLDQHSMTGIHHLGRSPSIPVCVPELPVTDIPLYLVFAKTLKLPIFTMNQIISHDESPVQVFVAQQISSADPNTITAISLSSLPFPLKIEIIVLEGDFPGNPDGEWKAKEFEDGIVRARKGKRPLLAGDFIVNIGQGGGGEELVSATFANLQLTDNSSWLRSGKFRLGARVIFSHGNTIRIREAVTEAFKVRDHRGESYKKHYPPKFEDEVWRLEGISKGNKKLASAGVKTVGDLLRMSEIDPQFLKTMIGSEKNWKASLKHAKTCELHGDPAVLPSMYHVRSASNEVGGLMQTDTESTINLFQMGYMGDGFPLKTTDYSNLGQSL